MSFWSRVIKYRLVSFGFLASLMLVLGAWLKAYLTLWHINQPLIFHFSNYAGITEIGDLGSFGNVAVFSLLAVCINFVLALSLEERDKFWGKLLMTSTFFFAVLIFIGFMAIISVN